MDVSKESCEILGILCYLNFPKYLINSTLTCIEDIFDKIEEEIQDLEIEICELECYYKLITNENDKITFLDKINNKNIQLTDMKNQLSFIKK